MHLRLHSAQINKGKKMFFRRKKDLFVRKSAGSVRSKDPLCEFKKATRGEMGRYSIEGEVWKAVRKLLLLALALAAVFFVYECWLSWNIFQ